MLRIGRPAQLCALLVLAGSLVLGASTGSSDQSEGVSKGGLPDWLCGTWRGEVLIEKIPNVFELSTTSADAGHIVAALKQYQEGKLVMFGLVKVSVMEDGATVIDYFWNGDRPVRLLLKSPRADEKSVEFVNQENWWPSHVSYSALTGGSLRWVATGRGKTKSEEKKFEIVFAPVKR
jgi:hypothetical protein